MTGYIRGLSSSRAILKVSEPPGTLDKWRLGLKLDGRDLLLRSLPNGAEPKAIGIIVRVRHPRDPDFVAFAVFGDRAESTRGVAGYLRNRFREIAGYTEEVDRRAGAATDALVIVVGFEGERFTTEHTLLVATRVGEPLHEDSDRLREFAAPELVVTGDSG